jgi:hypothetical protein
LVRFVLAFQILVRGHAGLHIASNFPCPINQETSRRPPRKFDLVHKGSNLVPDLATRFSRLVLRPIPSNLMLEDEPDYSIVYVLYKS